MARAPEHIDLTSWIHEELKSQILEHKLKPGQKIIQEEVAEDLGVSRTPLLKVLQILEAEFLVESKPRRGYYVREISNKEMIDVFDCREVLEGLAARLVAERANDSEIETIKNCFSQFIESDGPINEEEYEKADQRFHSLISKVCNNKMLARLEMIGNVHILAYQKGLLRPPEETLSEHKKIITALLNRNGEEAERAMRIHIKRSRESLKEKID
ncbi:GntR family transcriptional regulator [Aliifodinibius sp. S!AR15-10]|uniref:GntR family transcriptional regulator n=1 Tax=Aliifodinibius sp. S!AR15-10 TaxID=2950437 RepID=UPI00285F0345|nr:GntR family transcriptional regulator [Aliifodinibius sp. S!AR15-10]MDR8389704.1 GntR family transcriptional regulator [Aliifodinibius sp. S!AR15-10]